MKYYVTKLLTNTEGQDAPSINVFPDKDAEGKPIDAKSNALVNYHNTLAAYHNADDVLYAVVMITNELGNTEIKEEVNHRKNDIPVYTVSFNSHGGSDVPSQSVEFGEYATEPESPTRDGYTFVGWELDGYPYDFTLPVTRDIVLVAQWEVE